MTEGQYLTVEAAAKFCAERGVPYAVSTFNRLRCDGGGPGFVRVGPRKIAYPRQALVEWLNSRVGPVVNSTSQYAA
jgi:hypothetical protein